MSTLLARLNEVCNPVLVKDVRAALRGRIFRFVLLFEVAIALLVGLLVLSFADSVDEPEVSGLAYFGTVFGCLALGVHFIVPFGAMQSLSSEHDEHTLEFLQLSGIAAWRIVLGKLLSALLQALLVYSAFLPFLVFAFLLRGVALETIVASLVISVAICCAQVSAALTCGALAQTRMVRVVLSVLLLIGLMYTGPFAFAMLAGATFGARSISAGGALGSAVATTVVVASTATIGLSAFASVLLAHAEENRSTPIRVATTFVCLVGCGFACLARSLDEAMVELVITMTCITPALFFVATERERLPRVVAAAPSRWVRRFPLLAPWLPGGGRGAAFAFLHLFGLLCCGALLAVFAHPGGGLFDAQVLRLASTMVLVWVYVLLPSAIAAPFLARPNGVVIVRFVLVLFAVGCVVTPQLLGYLLRIGGLGRWNLMETPWRFDDPGPRVLLFTLGSLAVVLNLPRMLRGMREVFVLRRTRAREESVAASEP